MKLGMAGLGRMGSNMVRRLPAAGHECVAFDVHPEAAAHLGKAGAFGSRGADGSANKVLSALRYQFGGHAEKRA